MVDDLEKRLADRKRISLTQEHEVAYMREVAREQLALLTNRKIGALSYPKLRRICKGLLKCLDRIKKLEKKIERVENGRKRRG